MKITIINDLDNIGIVHDKFTEYASRTVRDKAVIQKLSIVIDEVLSNIISYAYTDVETHEIHVSLRFKCSDQTTIQGRWYSI